jgi:hypothetical protein
LKKALEIEKVLDRRRNLYEIESKYRRLAKEEHEKNEK